MFQISASNGMNYMVRNIRICPRAIPLAVKSEILVDDVDYTDIFRMFLLGAFAVPYSSCEVPQEGETIIFLSACSAMPAETPLAISDRGSETPMTPGLSV